MSQMLASDDRNAEFVGARNPDANLWAEFYVRSVQDNFKSEKAGHPVFHDEQFVKIMTPGRADLIIDEPVNELHKMRFPRQWAIFENRNAPADYTDGTPVSEWPAITRSKAEALKGKKFFTVQQIAGCSDAQIQALGMEANMLRQKARAFLESAKNTALAQQQAAELERGRAEIAELKRKQEETDQIIATLVAADKAAKQAQAAQMAAAAQASGQKK